MDREAILAEARGWLGTPYHSGARVRGAGVDCAQLLVAVFVAAGAIPAIEPRYVPDWHLHRSEEKFLGWLERFADRIDEADAKPGDVFVWQYGRCFSHAAIYMGDRQLIHAVRKLGVVHGSLDEGELAERPRLCYSLRGA